MYCSLRNVLFNFQILVSLPAIILILFHNLIMLWSEKILRIISVLQKLLASVQFSQFSCSVVSNSLWPHELQHARPPCPSPTPRVHPNTCPLSCWCHPTISSSVVPFSSCLQSFPASRSFPMIWLFASGRQGVLTKSCALSIASRQLKNWAPF